MNISYARKSKFNLTKTLDRLKKTLKKEKFIILDIVDLKNVTLIYYKKDDWLNKLSAKDPLLISFMPNPFVLYSKNTNIYLGIGKGTVLSALNNSPEVQQLAVNIEQILNTVIDEVTQAGPLKPSKVILYSTMTCPYCSMEKSWLEQKKIDFDIVYVDLNREAGQELVKKTGQMGVPVTEIQYEDMDSEYVIGFNKPILAKLLGVSQ